MFKTILQYYVYIMTNQKNGTLYTGVSNDLQRRVIEHNSGLIEGFTKKNGLKILVYYESYQYVMDAIKREKIIKKWRRMWKIELIEKNNPDWNDLAADWKM